MSPRSAEVERPIKIAPQRQISVPLVSLLAMLAATASVVFGYTKLTQADDRHETEIKAEAARGDEHDRQLRTLESAVIRMDAKLDAIKEMLDEQREGRRDRSSQ